MIRPLAYLLLAFLAGSLPFGLWIARIARGVDVRAHGSGNIGATNVLRVAGTGWGILALALDVAKGWLAVALFPAALDRQAQASLVQTVLAAVADAPFHSPVTPGGRPFSVQMSNLGPLGWVSDRAGCCGPHRSPSSPRPTAPSTWAPAWTSSTSTR